MVTCQANTLTATYHTLWSGKHHAEFNPVTRGFDRYYGMIGGAEILPVPWDDNYFSLLPGESREVTATFAAKDAGEDEPTLEVGGWNVESDFDGTALTVSPKEVKAGGLFTVTADVSSTFLDGSRVALRLDGEPVAFRWAWARAGRKESLGFALTLKQSGRHEIAVGGQKISVTVPP